nr:hypothetical protein [Mycolicibacterium goodii]
MSLEVLHIDHATFDPSGSTRSEHEVAETRVIKTALNGTAVTSLLSRANWRPPAARFTGEFAVTSWSGSPLTSMRVRVGLREQSQKNQENFGPFC